MGKSNLLKQLGQDLSPETEADKLSEKYGFPISLINLYDIAMLSENRIAIHDGTTTVVLNPDKIDENKETWLFIALGKYSLTIGKKTRSIFISIL